MLRRTFCLRGVFANVPMGPPDPILGLSLAFAADTFPTKVNLGAGVYRGDDNKPFVLECIKKVNLPLDFEYAPIIGVDPFVKAAQGLAFTPESTVLAEKRVATAQALGGTGALRIGADLLNRFVKGNAIYVPNPTWGNHLNVMKDAGLNVARYRYFDAKRNALDLSGLLEDLNGAPAGSIVLLHACAHNPTGIDPNQEQWKEIVSVMKKRGLFPFVDMAYQGFASGDLDQDAWAARLVAKECPSMILAQSFSKNFGLYGQRLGAVHVVCDTKDDMERVLSQVKIIIRPMYSNPAKYGAALVNGVLADPALTALWKTELKAMADRMNGVRGRLVNELARIGSTRDWTHITSQIGMMAFTGLSKEQVTRLRTEFHVYMTDDGRAAISGLNSQNVEYVAKCFHEVTK